MTFSEEHNHAINSIFFFFQFKASGWNSLSVGITKEGILRATLNGYSVWERKMKESDEIPSNGFAAMGTKTFGLAQFDDFSVTEC